MKLEAAIATETPLVNISRRPRAGLVTDATTPVLALWETLEGSEPSTNEAPHWDSRTDLEDETVEGTSLTQILYDALLQSVQVMLAGSEVGGFWVMLTTFCRVSGPVMVSTLVRVSVTQKTLPCLRQNILRNVGYNSWTDLVRVDGSDVIFKSVEQPAVKFATMDARVALLQAGPLHILPSQVVRGGTRELLAGVVNTGKRVPVARHLDASGFEPIVVMVVRHCDDSAAV